MIVQFYAVKLFYALNKLYNISDNLMRISHLAQNSIE